MVLFHAMSIHLVHLEPIIRNRNYFDRYLEPSGWIENQDSQIHGGSHRQRNC